MAVVMAVRPKIAYETELLDELERRTHTRPMQEGMQVGPRRYYLEDDAADFDEFHPLLSQIARRSRRGCGSGASPTLTGETTSSDPSCN